MSSEPARASNWPRPSPQRDERVLDDLGRRLAVAEEAGHRAEEEAGVPVVRDHERAPHRRPRSGGRGRVVVEARSSSSVVRIESALVSIVSACCVLSHSLRSQCRLGVVGRPVGASIPVPAGDARNHTSFSALALRVARRRVAGEVVERRAAERDLQGAVVAGDRRERAGHAGRRRLTSVALATVSGGQLIGALASAGARAARRPS